MKEFVEELKSNQKIKGTETIRIDYVIERLEENIEKLLDSVYYFEYHSKNLTNKQYEELEKIRDNLEDKGIIKK